MAKQKKEFEHMDEFLRELVSHPEIPIDSGDLRMIIDNTFDRPMLDGQSFPEAEVLQKLVSRMMGDPERLRYLERSPLKPFIALLPYISQVTTQYIEWASNQNSENEPPVDNAA